MRYLVIGGGGYAQEVAWSLRTALDARGADGEICFFDDRLPLGPVRSGLGEIVGGLDQVGAHAAAAPACLVLGVGLPRTKAAVVARLAAVPLPWTTVVHPAATIGPGAVIGEGSYIGAGAIVTVNVTIGRFATVNLHCQVAHEDVLGDFVTLHPDVHLSGDVIIAEGCELGTGAVVTPGVRVGPWAVLGAGTVAVRSLPGGHVYVGMPARMLARRPASNAGTVADDRRHAAVAAVTPIRSPSTY